MEMLFHHFALENGVQMWQVRREKCERFQEARAHYRDYGSGWVIFGRTASGKGVHGARNRAAYQSFMAIPHRASSARWKNLSSPLISPLWRSFRQLDSESYYCRARRICTTESVVRKTSKLCTFHKSADNGGLAKGPLCIMA